MSFRIVITELPSWNNGSGISVERRVGCAGSFEPPVGYSRCGTPILGKPGSYFGAIRKQTSKSAIQYGGPCRLEISPS